MGSRLGVTFKDFYVFVSLIYKDKLQDITLFLMIFNELYPNYHFQVTRKMARGSVLKGLSFSRRKGMFFFTNHFPISLAWKCLDIY